MNRTLSSLAKKLYRRLSPHGTHIEQLYERENYLDAYARHTDMRVASDPHEAIGGMWERIGQLQFDFVVNNGLRPQHRLLDIGCGTLRGGRHFIKYLNAGNYTGMDISPKAIEHGKQFVMQEGLSDKQPRLLVSKNKDLTFKEFSGETFDYLLAQSVFTHLKPEHITECFQHVGQTMRHDSVFFFTFNQSTAFEQIGHSAFCYPFAFLSALADSNNFEVTDRSIDYPHPRSQRMVMLVKSSAAKLPSVGESPLLREDPVQASVARDAETHRSGAHHQ